MVEDDGCDYIDHLRGHQSHYEEDNGCGCNLGQLVDKAEITRMCWNCEHYEDGYCTNKKKMKAISDMFAIGERVQVKKPENKCEEYKLNMNVFEKLNIKYK